MVTRWQRVDRRGWRGKGEEAFSFSWGFAVFVFRCFVFVFLC